MADVEAIWPELDDQLSVENPRIDTRINDLEANVQNSLVGIMGELDYLRETAQASKDARTEQEVESVNVRERLGRLESAGIPQALGAQVRDIRELKEKQDDITRNLHVEFGRLQPLPEQMNAMEERVGDLDAKIARIEGPEWIDRHLQALNQDHAGFQTIVDRDLGAIHDELVNMDNKYGETQAQLAQSQQRAEQLDNTMQDNKAEADETRGELQNLSAHHKEFEDHIGVMVAHEIDIMKAEIDDRIDGHVKPLRDHVGQLAGDMRQLTADFREIRGNVVDLRGILATKADNEYVDGIVRRLADYQQRVGDLEAQIIALRGPVGNAMDRLGQLNDQLAAVGPRLDEHGHRLGQLNDQLAAVGPRLDEHGHRLGQLNDQVERNTHLVDEHGHRLDVNDANFGRLRDETGQLVNRLDEHGNRLNVGQEGLQQHRNLIDMLIDETRRIDHIDDQLAALGPRLNEIGILEKDIAMMHGDITHIRLWIEKELKNVKYQLGGNYAFNIDANNPKKYATQIRKAFENMIEGGHMAYTPHNWYIGQTPHNIYLYNGGVDRDYKKLDRGKQIFLPITYDKIHAGDGITLTVNSKPVEFYFSSK